MNILLKKLLHLSLSTIIDGRPLACENIVKELELVHVMLGNLDCVENFNIIHSPEHSIILTFPWLELHNLNID